MRGDIFFLIVAIALGSYFFWPEDPRDVVIREQAAAAHPKENTPSISERITDWLIRHTNK